MSSLPPRDDPAPRAREPQNTGGARAADPGDADARHVDRDDARHLGRDDADTRQFGRDDTDPRHHDRGDAGPRHQDRDDAGARAAGARDAHAEHHPTDRQSVLAREKERFGGIKWGSAFFGWLTAVGTAAILTSLLAAGGTAVGLNTGLDDQAAQQDPRTLGLAGAIALLVVLFVAYYCGGYVAGRMARFSGAKQGVAVLIWTIVITAALAIIAAVLGNEYNVLDRIGGFPRLPVGGDDATAGGIIAVVIALVAALVGAILGGLAGMRYHRKVDRHGLEH